MGLLMLGVFGAERKDALINWLSIALLILAGLIVAWLPEGRLVTFGGSFVVDPFARFLKLLALAGSAAAILMSFDYPGAKRQYVFEYAVLIVLSTTGMFMLIS